MKKLGGYGFALAALMSAAASVALGGVDGALPRFVLTEQGIPADDGVVRTAEIQALIDNEVEFWQTYVTKDRPPLADGSDSSMDTLSKMYPTGGPSSTQVVGMDQSMKNYIELGEAIKRLKAQQDEVKAQLCQTLGEKSIGIGQDYTFSWKNQSSNRVDTKKLKELYPKVYEDCVQQTESRVFRIKENK